MIRRERHFEIQAVLPVPEDTAGAKFELLDGGKILNRFIGGKRLSRFDTREEAEKEATEILIDDQIDRSALAHFLATGGTVPDDMKALSTMWTTACAEKYNVKVTYDYWDSHNGTEDERRALYEKEKSEARESGYPYPITRGTIVIDAVERKWWLWLCQNVGQIICIDFGDDCHYWHLDWVMRPDWPVINFVILDTLVRRHPKTADGDGAGEKMERIRRFEYRCGFCGEWNAAKSVCPCGGKERMRQYIESLKSEQL